MNYLVSPLLPLYHSRTLVSKYKIVRESNYAFRFSKLRIKVLVFKNLKHFNAYASNELILLPKSTSLGLCDSLDFNYRSHDITIKDSRFCSIICLIATRMSIMTIAHECTHAAHDYRARVKTKAWREFLSSWKKHIADEEAIAYITGGLTEAIIEDLIQKKLLRL